MSDISNRFAANTMWSCEDCLSVRFVRASFPKGTSLVSPHTASRMAQIGRESQPDIGNQRHF